jgi:hypothetical protein
VVEERGERAARGGEWWAAEKEATPEGSRREVGRAGLDLDLLFYFLPFSFLILLKLKSI